MWSRWVRNDTAWLITFIVVVLGFPLILGKVGLRQVPFNAKPGEKLVKEQPEIIFVGDSMLGSRLDPDLLTTLSGRKVSLLLHNGSASAMWYLFLKNYIPPDKEGDLRVVVFFRDRYLTDPTFRLGGQYAEEVQAAVKGEDPLIDKFNSAPGVGNFDWLAKWLERFYPVQKLHDPIADKITGKIEGLAQAIMPQRFDYQQKLDAVFDLKNLRKDVSSELASRDLVQEPFNPSGDASFLPHMVELAEDKHLDLAFFRVKRRPQSGNIRSDSVEMTDYMHDLRDYLQGHQVELYDETADASITLDYYGDGDHVAEEDRRRYTEEFFHKHQEIFQ